MLKVWRIVLNDSTDFCCIIPFKSIHATKPIDMKKHPENLHPFGGTLPGGVMA